MDIRRRKCRMWKEIVKWNRESDRSVFDPGIQKYLVPNGGNYHGRLNKEAPTSDTSLWATEPETQTAKPDDHRIHLEMVYKKYRKSQA
jgi:hypothetical protein